MSRSPSTWRHYISIARPDHWVKHIFILPGIVAAIVLSQPSLSENLLLNCIVGLTSACLIASANYVINEWLDAESDRNHPEKSTRPAAVGLLKAKYVYAEYAILSLSGLLAAYAVNTLFFVMALALLTSGVFYNVKPFRIKDRIYLDVLAEALNNPIRLVMGWAMVSSHTIPPLSLIVTYWAGGAFLMTAKRLSEYQFILKEKGASAPGLYRRSFSFYSMESLVISCFIWALTSAFGIAIFLIKYRAEFIFTFPVIIVLFSYYLHLGFQSNSVAQKPELLHRDKRLIVIIAVLIMVASVNAFIDLPAIERIIRSRFVEIHFE